jgi:hypothetical protein
VKDAEHFVAIRELFPLLVRARHVTAETIFFFVEENRQMAGQRFAVGVRDQSRERVRVNERVDRLSIFNAIKRRNVHQKEVTSKK